MYPQHNIRVGRLQHTILHQWPLGGDTIHGRCTNSEKLWCWTAKNRQVAVVCMPKDYDRFISVGFSVNADL